MECFSENIVRALKDIADRNLISLETLQNRITKCIIDLSVNESLHILESFLSADLTNVENKELYLYEMFLDHLNTIKKTSGKVVYLDGSINDISDKNKINQLLQRTGYDLTISSGQRRYGGPPPNWTGDPPDCSNPSTCSQVHIGKLAQTVFEDILVPLLETCGKIYQLRIMVDPTTGNNKGYGFVDFFAHAEAVKCVELLNNKNLLGSHIQVKITIPNCRLWVAGFSKKRNIENINYEFKRHFPTVVEIKAFEAKNPGLKNKGFCFLIFKNHNEANEARKKLLQNKVLIFNHPIRECEWADPIEGEEKSDVLPRKIHIKFLTGKIDREFLESTFAQFGEIKNLDLFEQYAFVEFNNENSVNNILAQNVTEINNQKVNVSVAKTSKLSKEQMNRRKRHFKDRQRMRPEFMFGRLPDYRDRNRKPDNFQPYDMRRGIPPRDLMRYPEYPEYYDRNPPRDFYPPDYPPRGPRELMYDYPKYPEYDYPEKRGNEPVANFDRPPRREPPKMNDFPRKDYKGFPDSAPPKNFDSAPPRFPPPPSAPPMDVGSNAYTNYRAADPGRPMPPPRLENPGPRAPVPSNYSAPPPYQMPHMRQW